MRIVVGLVLLLCGCAMCEVGQTRCESGEHQTCVTVQVKTDCYTDSNNVQHCTSRPENEWRTDGKCQS